MTPGCFLCGNHGEFRVEPGESLREAACPVCGAKKRSSDLAAVILGTFADGRTGHLAAMPETLAALRIYEAQAAGALHDLLAGLPCYTCSEYIAGVPEGTVGPDGVRCENLEHLSFADNSFDLVITQDVLEHVGRPADAFREIQRVLKPGGFHIFTVPVHEGHKTTSRIAVEGTQRIEQTFAVHHGDPLRADAGSLVYTDFGDDLVSYLERLSIPSQVVFAQRFYASEAIPWLADERARAQYLAARERGGLSGFLLYNSVIVKTWKPIVNPQPEKPAEFSGERYIPTLDWPEVALEHWHRYFHAAGLVHGKAVLDIACGEGYGSFLLAADAASVVGIDLDGATIAHAAHRYARGNLTFATGSCVKVPVPDHAVFDVVVSFETIEHLSSLEQKLFVAEVKRLLKPGGMFIVSTPNKLLYSDVPGSCNAYHVKEFYVDEFKSFLRSHFAHVKLLGQKVYPVSCIWGDDARSGSCSEYGLEFRDGRATPAEGGKQPLYAIGLCSDAEIAASADSILIDRSERMLKLIKDLEAYGGRLAERLRVAEADGAARGAQIDALTTELAGLREAGDERVRAMERQLDRQAAEIARLAAPKPPSPR